MQIRALAVGLISALLLAGCASADPESTALVVDATSVTPEPTTAPLEVVSATPTVAAVPTPVTVPTSVPTVAPTPSTVPPTSTAEPTAALQPAPTTPVATDSTPTVPAATAPPAPTTAPPVTGSQDVLAANGGEVYTLNCARCHGENGLGSARYGGLINVGSKYTTNAMIEELTNGHPVTFGFADRLSAEEIASVVAYVKATFP